MCPYVSNAQVKEYARAIHRGRSRMVGALRQTTWWGPLVVVRKKHFRAKSDVFKTRRI